MKEGIEIKIPESGSLSGIQKNYNESEIYFLVFTVLLVLEVLIEEVAFELLELLLVRTVALLGFVSFLGAGLLGFTAGFASFFAGAAFAVLCAVGVAAL